MLTWCILIEQIENSGILYLEEWIQSWKSALLCDKLLKYGPRINFKCNVVIIIKISTYFSEVSSRELLNWRSAQQFDSESFKLTEKWLTLSSCRDVHPGTPEAKSSNWLRMNASAKHLSQRNLVSVVMYVKFRATSGLCLFKQRKPWHFIQKK